MAVIKKSGQAGDIPESFQRLPIQKAGQPVRRLPEGPARFSRMVGDYVFCNQRVKPEAGSATLNEPAARQAGGIRRAGICGQVGDRSQQECLLPLVRTEAGSQTVQQLLPVRNLSGQGGEVQWQWPATCLLP